MIDCKDTINFKREFFFLDQTERLLTSDVFKRRKTKLAENKNNILCGVNIFRKKIEVKLRENLRAGSFGTVPGPILRENIGPATEQSDWLILVLGPLN